MKSIYKWQQLALVLLAFLALSCEDFLVEESVSNQTADNYYTTKAGFEDLTRSAYPLLRDIIQQRRLVLLGTDMFSQGAWDNAAAGVGDPINVYDAGLGATSPELELLWDLLYREVGRANTVISRADAVVGMEAGLLNTRVGEAKFLRALSFFYLVQQWGDVPMPVVETTGSNKEVIRVASAEVYTQIIADLTEAEAALPVTADQYGRATKGAAQFLLARVHLTRGWNYNNALGGSKDDFDKALGFADKIISAYPLADNYSDLFPKHSENPLTETFPAQNDKNPEIVFAIQYSSDVLTYGGDPTNPEAAKGNDLHSIFGGGAEEIPGSLGRSGDYNRHQGKFHTTPAMYRLYDPSLDSRYDHNFLEKLYALQDAPGFVPASGVDPIDIAQGDTVVLFRPWNDPAAVNEKGLDVGGTKRYAVINHDEYGVIDQSNYHSQDKTPMMWKFWEPGLDYGDAFGTFDFALFRSAEAYLIAAEAILKGASGGALGGAENYYNAIVDRALGANAGADPQQAADPANVSSLATTSYRATAANISIDMVLDERAREFLGESMRWYDLKRTGTLISRATAYNPWVKAKAAIKDYHLLRPIPLHELDRASTDIAQNPGY
ncbi:MAG: RagB/SusD family nutrient uptake outer membrane protein [Saprospiraceae bacterium]